MQQIGPDHYRYDATLNPDGVNIECRTYVVIAETPKCYWVISKIHAGYVGQESFWARDMVKTHRKLILKEKGRRRHCYPDRKDALQALVIRKKRQLEHIERANSVATLALKGAEAALAAGEALGDELKCGQDEYTERLSWYDW